MSKKKPFIQKYKYGIAATAAVVVGGIAYFASRKPRGESIDTQATTQSGADLGASAGGSFNLPTTMPVRELWQQPVLSTLTAAQVRQLQSSLMRKGFNPGPNDGIPGPRTWSAIEQYRRSRVYLVPGIPLTQTEVNLINAF